MPDLFKESVNQVVINKGNARLIMRESGSHDGTLIVSVFDGCQWAYVCLEPAEAGAIRLFLNSFQRDRDVAEDLKNWTGG